MEALRATGAPAPVARSFFRRLILPRRHCAAARRRQGHNVDGVAVSVPSAASHRAAVGQNGCCAERQFFHLPRGKPSTSALLVALGSRTRRREPDERRERDEAESDPEVSNARPLLGGPRPKRSLGAGGPMRAGRPLSFPARLAPRRSLPRRRSCAASTPARHTRGTEPGRTCVVARRLTAAQVFGRRIVRSTEFTTLTQVSARATNARRDLSGVNCSE